MTQFNTYRADERFGPDYQALRDFLIKLDSCNYSFGRWDWMISHGYLDVSGLPRIGLWTDDGRLVAAATYDCGLGSAYLLALPGYEHLRAEMLAYAETALAKGDSFRVLIADGDGLFQDIAAARGYYPTQEQERDAVFPIKNAEDIRYELPEGFRITSMKDNYDLYQYGRVLWKGFNHELDGEGPFAFNEAVRESRDSEFMRPHVDLNIKIAVAAPNGDFVAYCGMWFDPQCQSALVEPVATDPAYRKQGMGRAAVLEGVRRCGLMGAKRAFVGSSQPFYYRIGFRPHASSTWWERKR